MILDFRWRLPARLWCSRDDLDSDTDMPVPTKLASGSLEEMIRRAKRAPEDERARMFIDCDGRDEPLTWPSIEKLSRTIEFPVNI